MGVGISLVFLLCSILAALILLTWVYSGPVNTTLRKRIGFGIIAFITLCWFAFLYFGISQGSELGGWALLGGICLSILSLFVPILYKYIIRDRDST